LVGKPLFFYPHYTLSFFLQDQMAQLPPLLLPKKPVGMANPTGTVSMTESMNTDSNLQKLSKDTSQLLKVSLQSQFRRLYQWFDVDFYQDLYKTSACPKIVDITKRKPGSVPVTEKASPMKQLVENTANLNALQKLTAEVKRAP
jgi:dynactin 1